MAVYREPSEADVYVPAPPKKPKRVPWPHWDTFVSALIVVQAPLVLGAIHDVSNSSPHIGLIYGVGVISGVAAFCAAMRKFFVWGI